MKYESTAYHYAEIALIMALPAFLIDQKVCKPKSRLEGILKRIFKHAQKHIRAMPQQDEKDISVTYNRLNTFFNKMRWHESHTLDLMMMISFLLGLIEESHCKYSDLLINALNDCYEQAVYGRCSTEISAYLREAEDALNVWHRG